MDRVGSDLWTKGLGLDQQRVDPDLILLDVYCQVSYIDDTWIVELQMK